MLSSTVHRKYDLAVAYRIYPRISKNPAAIPDNKMKMAELCLKSFKNSLGLMKVKLWVLLDNCPSEYEELFRRYFHEDDLKFIGLQAAGNLKTFDKQLEILCEQTDAEVVYFAEGGYFYLPNHFEHMVKFFSGDKDVDFVSPYDHPDYYFMKLHKYRNYIRVFYNRHWRTAGSTCIAFLTKKTTLQETAPLFKSYTKRNYNVSLFHVSKLSQSYI